LHSSNYPKFDIVFVVGYFRSSLPFLSAIKHLSNKFRIGLIVQPLEARLKDKIEKSQKEFVDLCLDAGAELITIENKIEVNLMVIQQFIYTPEFVGKTKENIKTKKILGVLGLASSGLHQYDAFIKQFGILKVAAIDKNLINFLLLKRNAKSSYANLEVIEVGYPFKKYPILPGFAVDWVVAAPTMFSFYSEMDKQQFLRDVLKLFGQIPTEETIVYKSHNGNEKDYFAPFIYFNIAHMIELIPNITFFLEVLVDLSKGLIGKYISRILTVHLYRKVIKRAKPMASITPYHQMSLESFLPGVRKGVIGGESNIIWGVTRIGLPYFNCVFSKKGRTNSLELMNKNGDNLLGVNLEFFGVPYCRGLITEGATFEKFSVFSEKDSNLVDLIEQICII
jgi:hypothetical protein